MRRRPRRPHAKGRRPRRRPRGAWGRVRVPRPRTGRGILLGLPGVEDQPGDLVREGADVHYAASLRRAPPGTWSPARRSEDHAVGGRGWSRGGFWPADRWWAISRASMVGIMVSLASE